MFVFNEMEILEAQTKALNAGYTALDHALLAARSPEDHPQVIDETVDRLLESGDIDKSNHMVSPDDLEDGT